MGKKISDLFAKNGEVTKMISNDTNLKSSDINSTDSSFKGVTIPKRVDANGASINAKAESGDPLEIITNVVQKYQSLTSSPASIMRILTGDFKINAKQAAEVIKLPEFTKGDIASNGLLSHMFGPKGGLIEGKLDSIGLGESSLVSDVIRTGAWIGGKYTLPMDMHPLDVLNLTSAVASSGIFGDKLDGLLGRNADRKKLRPRWTMVAPLSNSPVALKALMANSKEGERMRIGWRIPDHITQTFDSNGNKVLNQLRSVKSGSSSSNPNSNSKLGNSYLAGKIDKNTRAGAIAGMIMGDGSITDAGDPAEASIYGNFQIGSPAIKDYAVWEDYPYDLKDFGDVRPENREGNGFMSLFSTRMNNLRDAGLLSGYADWAGFEIGSDHQWKLEIYPYVSKEHGNGTCTPELPVFFVPNIWRFNRKDTRLVKDTSVRIADGTAESNLIAKEYPGSDGTYDYIAYSYSTCLPALSYDLSFGTVKTDSLRLFNGSTVEIFAGMNYNSILNVSILDDVYGSLHKYMFQYINACYDINTHSLAPYYNCAFEIILKILRPGGKIKEAHHFIGVPVEYTPRLEGQQDPNESRLDITFGIIGYVTPTVDKPWTDHDGREKNTNGFPDGKGLPKTPTWRDISFKAGQQVPQKPDQK